MEEFAVAAIVCFAAFTQSVVGFGFGLVSMGLLPLVIPELAAIPFVSLYALCVAAIIVFQVRANLSRDTLLGLLIGVLAGVPLGLFFLSAVDPTYIRLSLGIFLILYALYALFVARRLHEANISKLWGYPAGFLSGVLGGAFNTGGPPLVVYVTLKAWPKDTVKATLNALFVATGVVSLTGHAIAGRLTADLALRALLIAPAIGLGMWVGSRLYAKINQETYRRAMLLLLFVVGLVFINKSLQLV